GICVQSLKGESSSGLVSSVGVGPEVFCVVGGASMALSMLSYSPMPEMLFDAAR
ncbi:unnamed protein product, partial [Ilex paraguariensis]